MSQPESRRIHDAERPVFFTDAVVAIAMTLLILPLMESVAEAREGGAAHWLAEHRNQLLSFGLSFVLIGMFWRQHHQLFEHVSKVTRGMITLGFVWMFSIVCLPVATYLIGALPLTDDATGEYDRVLVTLYLGTMLVASLTLYLLNLALRHNPDVWDADNPPSGVGEAVTLSMAILFAVALVVALLLPSVNLGALLLLWLTWPVAKVLSRRLQPRYDAALSSND